MRLPICMPVLALALLGALHGNSHAQTFYGDLTLRPLDGEKMEVVSTFGFIDRAGRKWEAPAGHKTDGASIPRSLWSIVGSPFTGKYVKAAVIHDVYCDLKSREWADVHEAFYDAMILSGVGTTQAKVMFAAVYRFGPRWVVDRFFECPPGYSCYRGSGLRTYVEWAKLQPSPNADVMQELAVAVKATDPSLDDIRTIADKGFFADADFQISGRMVVEDVVKTPNSSDLQSILRLVNGRFGEFRATAVQRERFSRLLK